MHKMKSLLAALIAVAMMSSVAFAASPPPEYAAKAAEADADYKARFLSLKTFKGDLSSQAVGFDVDKPGKSVSYKTANGTIVQHGTSQTPRQFYEMTTGGGD